MSKQPLIKMTKLERTRDCAHCGVSFVARRCQIESGRGKYCSHRCAFDGGAHAVLFTPEIQALSAERRAESIAINGTKHGSGENNKRWLGGPSESKRRNLKINNLKSVEYAKANPEKRAAAYKKYEANNPEKVLASKAAWRANNPEKAAEIGKNWRKKNPELLRVYQQNRRAREKECGGALSKDIAKKLFLLQRGLCACCGKPLGNKFHLDHIMPIILGGENSDKNIQLLRSSCNQKKHSKHPIDFMQSKGFLL